MYVNWRIQVAGGGVSLSIRTKTDPCGGGLPATTPVRPEKSGILRVVSGTLDERRWNQVPCGNDKSNTPVDRDHRDPGKFATPGRQWWCVEEFDEDVIVQHCRREREKGVLS